MNNQNAFKIDQYVFNFDLPIYKASFFNEYIYYKNIDLYLQPKFNLNFIKDYEIDVNQKNLDDFISNINNNEMNTSFEYRNSYDISDTNGVINLGLKNDESTNLLISSDNFFGLEQPLFNLVSFQKFSTLPILIKNINLEIIYKIQNELESKKIDFKINDQLWYENEFALSINDNKEIINRQDFYYNNKGIYFYMPTIGQINLSFDLEYNQKNRHFVFNKQFTFEKDIKKLSLSLLKKEKDIKNINLPLEVQSDKIF